MSVVCRDDGCGWLPPVECACGCHGGDCAPRVCEQGDMVCAGDAVWRCPPDGCDWVDSDVPCACGCADGACRPLRCEPGGAFCVDGLAVQCTADGCGIADRTVCPCGCADGACVPCTQCKAGPCCDAATGLFLPAGTPCATWQEKRCAMKAQCGDALMVCTVVQACSGADEACDGAVSSSGCAIAGRCGEEQACHPGIPCVDDARCKPVPPPAGPCCEATRAGCGSDAVSACVCESDPCCCSGSGAWDHWCAQEVASLGCGTCDPEPAPADCCAARSSPGCPDAAVEACVCAELPSCCTDAWGASCIGVARQMGCASCGQHGPCDVPSRSPGCSDPATRKCVCDRAPWCCQQAWDAACVAEVVSFGCG